MSDDKTPADPTPADVAREEPVWTEPSTPLVEPVETRDPADTRDPVFVEPVEVVETPGSGTGFVEPVPVTTTETARSESVAYTEPASRVEPVAVAPVAPVAPQNVVYVSAPVAPRARGNRGVGALLAVLGAALFAVVYAAAYALATIVTGAPLTTVFAAFISSALFWVPVLIFLVVFVLLVLVLNRAGWWAHVIGSLIVALVVYLASAGALMVVGNLFFAAEGSSRPFAYYLAQPGVIIAGIVAREVSIWIGLAIAARGRRLTVRNREARAEFEREQAEKRAEYGQQTTSS